MIFIKIVGGIILIIIGLLIFKFELKDRKRKGSYSEIVNKSVSFQGFVLSIILIIVGIYLVLTCFY